MSDGLPTTQVASPDIVLEAAREYAREGRESHVRWAEHLRVHSNGEPCEACTDEVIATAGDVDVQVEWVRKYDVILLALDLVDETLATRFVDALAKLADEGMRDRAVYFARRALRYRQEARRARWNGLWRHGAGTIDDPNNGRLIFRLTGLDAILYARRSDNVAAAVRTVYWWLIRRYKAELCQHCGRPVRVVFHAPDDIWEMATGYARWPDGEAAPGVLCPPCVDELVEPQVDGYLTWACEVTR